MEIPESIACISMSRNKTHLISFCIYEPITFTIRIYEFTDTHTFSVLHRQLNLYSVSTLLFPNTQQETLKNLINENKNINFVEIPRCAYKLELGMCYLENLKCKQFLVDKESKFFSITAIAALISFCLEQKMMNLQKDFKIVEFLSLENKMFIPLKTIKDLELIESGNKKGNTLFNIIKSTKTKMGSRFLKRNIMEPSYDLVEIGKRRDFVMFCRENEGFADLIESILTNFVDLESFLSKIFLLESLNDKNTVKCCVELCSIINSIEKFVQMIESGENYSKNEVVRELWDLLINSNYIDIKNKLIEFFNESSFGSKTSNSVESLVNAVKTDIVQLLDLTRVIYAENISDMKNFIIDNFAENVKTHIDLDGQYCLKTDDPELINHLIRTQNENIGSKTGDDENETKNPDLIFLYCKTGKAFFTTVEIQKINSLILDSSSKILEISAAVCKPILIELSEKIFKLGEICEKISLVDMLYSFYCFSCKYECTIPIFSDTFVCTETYNLFLKNPSVVKNCVYASEFLNFNVVTGENNGGKTTYCRQIAYLVILSQIGCPVNAKYASIKLFKSILTRLSNGDDLSANLSTFEVELVDAKMILESADEKTLVIIDEIGRGTNYLDGLSFALTVSENLIFKNAYVWFITHFKDIIARLKIYKTVNALKSVNFRIESGVYLNSNGISSAVNHLPTKYIESAKRHKDALIEKYGKNDVYFNNPLKETAAMILNCKTDEEKNYLKKKLLDKKE